MQGFRQATLMISSRVPTLMVKARAAREDGLGALERRADGVSANPDEAGGDEVIWQLVWQVLAGVMPRQGKSRSIYVFKFFNNTINRRFIIFLNSLGKTRGQPKTASASERPLSSLG